MSNPFESEIPYQESTELEISGQSELMPGSAFSEPDLHLESVRRTMLEIMLEGNVSAHGSDSENWMGSVYSNYPKEVISILTQFYASGINDITGAFLLPQAISAIDRETDQLALDLRSSLDNLGDNQITDRNTALNLLIKASLDSHAFGSPTESYSFNHLSAALASNEVDAVELAELMKDSQAERNLLELIERKAHDFTFETHRALTEISRGSTLRAEKFSKEKILLEVYLDTKDKQDALLLAHEIAADPRMLRYAKIQLVRQTYLEKAVSTKDRHKSQEALLEISNACEDLFKSNPEQFLLEYLLPYRVGEHDVTVSLVARYDLQGDRNIPGILRSAYKEDLFKEEALLLMTEVALLNPDGSVIRQTLAAMLESGEVSETELDRCAKTIRSYAMGDDGAMQDDKYQPGLFTRQLKEELRDRQALSVLIVPLGKELQISLIDRLSTRYMDSIIQQTREELDASQYLQNIDFNDPENRIANFMVRNRKNNPLELIHQIVSEAPTDQLVSKNAQWEALAAAIICSEAIHSANFEQQERLTVFLRLAAEGVRVFDWDNQIRQLSESKIEQLPGSSKEKRQLAGMQDAFEFLIDVISQNLFNNYDVALDALDAIMRLGLNDDFIIQRVLEHTGITRSLTGFKIQVEIEILYGDKQTQNLAQFGTGTLRELTCLILINHLVGQSNPHLFERIKNVIPRLNSNDLCAYLKLEIMLGNDPLEAIQRIDNCIPESLSVQNLISFVHLLKAENIPTGQVLESAKQSIGNLSDLIDILSSGEDNDTTLIARYESAKLQLLPSEQSELETCARYEIQNENVEEAERLLRIRSRDPIYIARFLAKGNSDRCAVRCAELILQGAQWEIGRSEGIQRIVQLISLISEFNEQQTQIVLERIEEFINDDLTQILGFESMISLGKAQIRGNQLSKASQTVRALEPGENNQNNYFQIGDLHRELSEAVYRQSGDIDQGTLRAALDCYRKAIINAKQYGIKVRRENLSSVASILASMGEISAHAFINETNLNPPFAKQIEINSMLEEAVDEEFGYNKLSRGDITDAIKEFRNISLSKGVEDSAQKLNKLINSLRLSCEQNECTSNALANLPIIIKRSVDSIAGDRSEFYQKTLTTIALQEQLNLLPKVLSYKIKTLIDTVNEYSDSLPADALWQAV